MRARGDEVAAMARAVDETRLWTTLMEMARDPDDAVRFTVGRLDVSPNSANGVPNRVRFSIDLRHRDAERLIGLGDAIAPLVDKTVAPAFHDAAFYAEHCPTAMVFVPCERGVSHHRSENAKPGELATGVRVVAMALLAAAEV